MKIIILCTFLLLPFTFKVDYVHVFPTKQCPQLEMEKILAYSGYGSKRIRKVLPYVSHSGEVIICLIEANNYKNNMSGFKGKSGHYEYSTLSDWGQHFRSVMSKPKYTPRGSENVREWLKKIAPVYNKNYQEEWLSRCDYWITILKI